MTELIITSTIIILVVLILRTALRNHVRHCCIYALWLMVVLRLAIPVTVIRSPLSVLNYINSDTLTNLSSDTSPAPKSDSDNTHIYTDNPDLSAFDSVLPMSNSAPADNNSDNKNVNYIKNTPSVNTKTTTPKYILLSVWIFGSIILGIFFITVNVLFYHKLVTTRRLLEKYTTGKINVYLVEDLNSPCIFGLFCPAVYLNPKALENPKNIEYILAHELCHLRHGDLFWSFIRCLLITVYWFHPLVWCAAILSKRDCEYACDESVLLQYERTSTAENEFHTIRTEYGSTLLFLIPQNTFSSFGIASTSMTSGKKVLKQRITYIVKKPKTTLLTVTILIAASLLAIGCTLTLSDNTNLTTPDETQTESVSEYHIPDGDFPEMAKHPGDMIYSSSLYLDNGRHTLQVVMTEAHYHVLPENKNHLSGSFVIQLLGEDNTLISETPLHSGGFTSELGTHIDVTPELLENTFEWDGKWFIHRIPYSENGETLYAVSVYRIAEDCTFSRFTPDESVPGELLSPDPDFIIVDNYFRCVPNIWVNTREGFNTNFWENYVTIQNTTHLSFYTFHDESSTISLSEDYSGRGEGEDIDAAMKRSEIRWMMAFPDHFATTNEPLEIVNSSRGVEGGYCPIDPAIADDELSLVEYIADAYTELSLSGYNSREEIRLALFETGDNDGNPLYKMVNGILCGNSTYYQGVPFSFSHPVAVSVNNNHSIIYYLSHGIDSRMLAKMEVIKCDDGKWRISSNPEHVIQYYNGEPLFPMSTYETHGP